MMACGSVNLPPGFCFSPTDEELLLHFLYPKTSLPCHPNIIPDLDLSLHHPWQLNGISLLHFYISNNLFNHMHACMDGSNYMSCYYKFRCLNNIINMCLSCAKLLIYKFHLFFLVKKTKLHDPNENKKSYIFV